MAGGLFSGAAFGTGLLQGDAQAQYLRQQYTNQLLEQQINQMMALGKLRDMNETEAAKAKLPQNEQDFLSLGGSVGDIQKRGDMMSQADFVRNELNRRMYDPSLPVADRIKAANWAASVTPGNAAEVAKAAGFGLKPDKQPFVHLQMGDRTFAFEGYNPDGTPKLTDIGAASAGQDPSQKMLKTPVGLLKGLNIINPDGTPWGNTMETAESAFAHGAVSINDKNKDLVDQSLAADDGLNDLLETGKKVLPDTPDTIGAAANPYVLAGKRALGDPAVADFDSAKSALITHLRTIAQASRVNAQELQQVNGALAGANSYPALEAAVRRAQNQLEKARLSFIKAGKLNPPTTSDPSDTSAPSKFTGGTPIGIDPKTGRTVYQLPDGTRYY